MMIDWLKHLFIYYYFLNRREGHTPVQSASNAQRWCWWWEGKSYGFTMGRAPLDDFAPLNGEWMSFSRGAAPARKSA